MDTGWEPKGFVSLYIICQMQAAIQLFRMQAYFFIFLMLWFCGSAAFVFFLWDADTCFWWEK